MDLSSVVRSVQDGCYLRNKIVLWTFLFFLSNRVFCSLFCLFYSLILVVRGVRTSGSKIERESSCRLDATRRPISYEYILFFSLCLHDLVRVKKPFSKPFFHLTKQICKKYPPWTWLGPKKASQKRDFFPFSQV